MATPADNVQKMSPRVRLAARLYATGLAPTKKAASEAAGLHPNYLTVLANNPRVKQLLNEVDALAADQTLDVAQLLDRLGRRAVSRIAHLMEHAESEKTQLEAAKDLADRSPKTQKVQKIDASVSAFTLAGSDVAALTQAMVESARLKDTYRQIAAEGLVEITDLQTPPAGEAA